jgi:hypothetical protein
MRPALLEPLDVPRSTPLQATHQRPPRILDQDGDRRLVPGYAGGRQKRSQKGRVSAELSHWNAVSEGVRVGEGVNVGVALLVAVLVGVVLGVKELVAVREAVELEVGLADGEAVRLGVGEGVGCGDRVIVALEVAVARGVTVVEGVLEGVEAGTSTPEGANMSAMPPRQ